ncbi:hypothetical protein BGX21_009306 [Mortierella sp. AD011]|nr:hypothetical protein BGX20_008950 [Mortierella sp. AD010]KAF9402643.1 hypothetical protein BGX21_009306 [Mortierella sp. AD011]
MLVRRRRQSGRRRSPDYGSRSLKDMLRIKGRRPKGSRKSDRLERSFYLMREESDDEEYGGDGDDEVTEKATKYQTSNSAVSLKAGPSEKPLIVFDEDEPERPADAHLDRSQRGSMPFPFIYSDDDFTMSSMRSSCETSSVVREYWAASMAARAERRMEGYPASTDFCSSASSQSRKADILSMDAPSFVDSAAGVGAGASTATRNSPFKKQYRSTINSIHSYIRRSMSMSIASLRSGESYTDDESWYTHPGFRSSINAEFLEHLNIKSLRSAQRQLEYYTYYYRQNPTMSTVDGSAYSRPFSQQSVVTSVDSQRISSAPSLTSTNDPFQTFDSNEIILDLNPASGNNNNATNAQGLPPPPPLMPIDGNAEQRSNSALLRSFPSPPVSDDSSSSVSSLQLDGGPERR